MENGTGNQSDNIPDGDTEWWGTWMQFSLTFVELVIFTLAIVSNGIVIALLIKLRTLRKHENALLAILAVCEFLYACNGFASCVASLLSDPRKLLLSSNSTCIFLRCQAFAAFYHLLLSWNLAVGDRLLTLTSPLHYRVWLKNKHICIATASSILLANVLAYLPAIIPYDSENVKEKTCINRYALSVIAMTIVFLTSAFVIAVYIIISIIATRLANTHRISTTASLPSSWLARSQSEHSRISKSVKTLLIIALLQVISRIPLIINVLKLADGNNTKSVNMPYYIDPLAASLCYIPLVCDPWIYTLKKTDFRSAMTSSSCYRWFREMRIKVTCASPTSTDSQVAMQQCHQIEMHAIPGAQ